MHKVGDIVRTRVVLRSYTLKKDVPGGAICRVENVRPRGVIGPGDEFELSVVGYPDVKIKYCEQEFLEKLTMLEVLDSRLKHV